MELEDGVFGCILRPGGISAWNLGGLYLLWNVDGGRL